VFVRCAHGVQLEKDVFRIEAVYRVLPWVYRWLKAKFQQLIEGRFLLFTHVVDKNIMGNAVQKRAGIKNFILALQTKVKAEKCFLYKVFGKFAVVALPAAKTEDRILVELVRRCKIVLHKKRKENVRK
jgi:hypothetical protein